MIPVLKPTIDEKTKKALMDVLDSGWWGQGPKALEFEEKFAKYVGAKYAIGCCSATAALDLCLKVYKIKGGELITTPMTFVADAIVGEWNGMDVTFADIDEETLCIEPKSMVLSADVKAIIVVDSHGRLADYKGIREEIEKYNRENDDICNPIIIQDAAHAMYTPGAGKGGDIAVWSFQAVKSLPTGDGGMITTDDEEIYHKLRNLTWLGVEKNTFQRAGEKKYTWDYDIIQAEGTKSYMNDINAVIGIGQLERLEETNAKRRAIQSAYNEAFKDVPQIKIPMYSHTVQYYTMQCEDRDGLCDWLAKNDVATSVHFKPLNKMTYWAKAEKRPLTVNNRVWLKLLSLPVHNALTWSEVEKITKLVKDYYK